MKISKFSLVLLSIIITGCLIVNAKDPIPMPERPKNVPMDARWSKISAIWSLGSENEGNETLWYEDGTFLYREFIVKKDYKKSIRYHKNGKIHRTGQERYFHDTYYREDDDGSLVGWLGIGKWKEYDEDGNLIHEWCYTPNENGFGTEEKCGMEIFYNKDGSIKKQEQKKVLCKYGCEELEYVDPVK